MVVIGAYFIGLETAGIVKDFLKEKTEIIVVDNDKFQYESVLGT